MHFPWPAIFIWLHAAQIWLLTEVSNLYIIIINLYKSNPYSHCWFSLCMWMLHGMLFLNTFAQILMSGRDKFCTNHFSSMHFLVLVTPRHILYLACEFGPCYLDCGLLYLLIVFVFVHPILTHTWKRWHK